MLIDQGRMFWLGRLDEGTATGSTLRIKTDSDELEALRVKFASQCLPHGQVSGAASIRRPRVQQNLLPAQARQAEFFSVQVRKVQIRRLRACQRT